MFNSEVKIISIKFENNLKHIAPKKSLGQNFLIDRTVSKKIVDSLEIQNNELIIGLKMRSQLTGRSVCSPRSHNVEAHI